MVYQRFLDSTDGRARNIEIRLDGDAVEPWNPYCEGLSTLVAEQVQTVELENGNEASFLVRAFVLPRREEFPDDHAATRARITNDRQGIYIYREQRLIHDADWLNMFQKEPHVSLLRVEFSFLHDLDDAFHVDIKKSRIPVERGALELAPRRVPTIPSKGSTATLQEGTKEKHSGKGQGRAREFQSKHRCKGNRNFTQQISMSSFPSRETLK